MRLARNRATSGRVRLTCGKGSGHVVGIDTCPGWQFKDMPPGPREKIRVNDKEHRYRGVNEGGWEKIFLSHAGVAIISSLTENTAKKAFLTENVGTKDGWMLRV